MNLWNNCWIQQTIDSRRELKYGLFWVSGFGSRRSSCLERHSPHKILNNEVSSQKANIALPVKENAYYYIRYSLLLSHFSVFFCL